MQQPTNQQTAKRTSEDVDPTEAQLLKKPKVDVKDQNFQIAQKRVPLLLCSSNGCSNKIDKRCYKCGKPRCTKCSREHLVECDGACDNLLCSGCCIKRDNYDYCPRCISMEESDDEIIESSDVEDPKQEIVTPKTNDVRIKVAGKAIPSKTVAIQSSKLNDPIIIGESPRKRKAVTAKPPPKVKPTVYTGDIMFSTKIPLERIKKLDVKHKTQRGIKVSSYLSDFSDLEASNNTSHLYICHQNVPAMNDKLLLVTIFGFSVVNQDYLDFCESEGYFAVPRNAHFVTQFTFGGAICEFDAFMKQFRQIGSTLLQQYLVEFDQTIGITAPIRMISDIFGAKIIKDVNTKFKLTISQEDTPQTVSWISFAKALTSFNLTTMASKSFVYPKEIISIKEPTISKENIQITPIQKPVQQRPQIKNPNIEREKPQFFNPQYETSSNPQKIQIPKVTKVEDVKRVMTLLPKTEGNQANPIKVRDCCKYVPPVIPTHPKGLKLPLISGNPIQTQNNLPKQTPKTQSLDLDLQNIFLEFKPTGNTIWGSGFETFEGFNESNNNSDDWMNF